ncbi:hypothetical protein V8G56_02255 [Gaetbulibacter aquiaggeris]|uniref:Secreted protein (Por secretion system target) n=1 Tax=Gaetbulibacter aquiaggeris TaxID=1735373 RepID=A0ABW7MMF0_9FLAO
MMHAKSTFIKSLSFLIVFFGTIHFGFGQSIFTNPITGTAILPILGTPYTTGQTIDPNITVSGIGIGPGVTGVSTNNAYNASSWGLLTSVTLDKYFEFTITPNAGYEIDFVNFVYTGIASNGNGPASFQFRSSVDGFVAPIGTPTATGATINLSGLPYQNITTPITFRFYGYNARSNPGDYSINNFTFNGSVSEIPCYFTTTWIAGDWDRPGGPNNREAIIAEDYDTSVNGNISTCSLTINAGVSLTVGNGSFVKVENDVIVDGELIVETQGNFVQYGNIFTGTGTVNKTTREYNDAELHYVYWSSPVASAEIATVFPNSYGNRRFEYVAENYVDKYKKGTLIEEPDGLDDDINDWQIIYSGPMDVGRGYVIAAAPPEEPYTPGSAYTDTAVFSGTFNTGDITVDIFRNDEFDGDANWNLIGNPYPSAINAEAFLLENFYDVALNDTGTIDGVIYLWTHNTAANPLNNGNYGSSYSRDDYASINLVGSVIVVEPTVSEPNQEPEAYIPSGQGFFVSYAEGIDVPGTDIGNNITQGEVRFTNTMKMADETSNSQFFKNSNIKGKTAASSNKLWVNLTSDNGVFNQILVGYLNIATNNYDGVAFDAPKYLSSDAPAILYTNIPDSDTKFVIQGKAESSLNENEVIPLGFDTKIDVATLYKLSVPYVQGDFLKNNKVYLKDNLLNTIHDLSESDYTFISEVGEFTNRFEIVFNAQALSADTFDLDANTVQIIQLDDTRVTFKASGNLNIKTVTIYDLLGRQLYQLEGSHNKETYNLSNLKHSVFIAKVALSNGALVTKKAIKK